MCVCVCVLYFCVCAFFLATFRIKGESDEVAARSYQGRRGLQTRILLHKAIFDCCMRTMDYGAIRLLDSLSSFLVIKLVK